MKEDKFTVAEETANNSEYIYDPLSQYKNIYKNLHNKNTIEYFDSLVEKSKVDLSANKDTVTQIKSLDVQSKKDAGQIKNFSFLRGLMIFLMIAIVVFYLTDFLIDSVLDWSKYFPIYVGVIFIVAFLVIIFAVINPRIKTLKNSKTSLDLKIQDFKKIAWNQTAPLNALFTHGISTQLFQKTTPQIVLDKMFDIRRYEYLVNDFGLTPVNDVQRSTLFVQSGDIFGNPFYICNDLIHRMGTKKYSGNITITWTTTSVVNGKQVTNYHSQVLTATVEKPCPYYSEQPYLVYGNEAAPDLIFQRQDSDAEIMSNKQIERKVNKDIKKLEKKSEKATINGQDYTVLGNSEFEVLFGATNRNNEVQFRLLFTPLAQKQLLDLMKDKEVAYGDDFDFVKNKMINYIYPEHLKSIALNVSPDYYLGYDIEDMKVKFVNYNNAYFKSIYFTFAPILAIPLYQQQKPHAYIYKDLYKGHLSFYEHENIVNMMNVNEFKHPLSQTRNILKTSFVKSGDSSDTISVTAYGYNTIQKTDFVNLYGGDGRFHSVPVNWIDYLPVQKQSDVEINVVQETKEKSYSDQYRNILENLKNKQVPESELFKVGSFIAYALKK